MPPFGNGGPLNPACFDACRLSEGPADGVSPHPDCRDPTQRCRDDGPFGPALVVFGLGICS
jgi:hypothetical protein